MINFTSKPRYDLSDLIRLVHVLRAPGGCPWDAAQTHLSIRRNFLEEAYEVAEAIDEKNPAHLKEELGDVLFQVMFHSEIEAERGNFTVDDVVNGICEKMIRRHPRIFGGEIPEVENEKDLWEAIKKREREEKRKRALHTD